MVKWRLSAVRVLDKEGNAISQIIKRDSAWLAATMDLTSDNSLVYSGLKGHMVVFIMIFFLLQPIFMERVHG